MPFTSSDTFKEIFQSSVEAIIMVDQEGQIVLANPVSEKMFGYEQGDLIKLSIENLLPMRFREKHVEYRKKFSENPEPRAMGRGRDLMARRKDGSEFPVAVSLSYTYIKENLLVMAFVSDITERKKAEEAIKRSEEQLLIYAAELEKKVQARTEALNLTIEKLERANQFLQEQIIERQRAEEEARKALEKERELNELKSKFVSIASHEFRTPLSTVLSSASLVSQYKERGDLEKIDKHVGRIKSSVNHLTSILNDFLSLGKLEEGRIEVCDESISLHTFLDEVLEELKLMLKEGQEFITNFEESPDLVMVDPKILRNILFNLISNASKYSDPGKRITLITKFENHTIQIGVKDEGIGIPEQDLKYMFDRFFRASNATNIQGSGLGLNIVKRYLDLLDGSIDFASQVGSGSLFTITLPKK